jgi:hypothetical protein
MLVSCAAGTIAESWVELVKVVLRAVVPNMTTEFALKFRPVRVIAVSPLPLLMAFGETEVSAGTR